MRLLFLSPLIPSVAYGHRPYCFLSRLARRGHEITLRCIDDPGPVAEAAQSLRDFGIRVEPFHLGRFQRGLNCLAGIAGSTPFRVLHCRSAAFRRRILEDLRSGGYDLFHVDRFRLAPYAEAAREVYSGPIVLDFPDALSLYYERAHGRSPRPLKAWIDRREGRVMPAYERAVLKADLSSIVCSEIDRDRLLEHGPDVSIHVVPNMVDVEDFFPRSRGTSAGPARCLFTGTLYYLPNIDGLLWLKEEILPLLSDIEFRIEVAGFGATSELDPVKRDPRFDFLGYVERMPEAMFEEDIYLCPLRVGAGVRFKLLEAFAAGMASISTTLGCEGIPCTPGEHLLVADTPAEFADAIRFLHERPDERKRLGKGAREFVLERYSVEAAGEALEKVYAESLAGRAGR